MTRDMADRPRSPAPFGCFNQCPAEAQPSSLDKTPPPRAQLGDLVPRLMWVGGISFEYSWPTTPTPSARADQDLQSHTRRRGGVERKSSMRSQGREHNKVAW